CLEEQVFIKDPAGKLTVAQSLKASNLQVVSFIRYQVGEGIEKKKDDFASEVARMAR
ncbi:MAG: elongation factor Ts, partial [Deltaproteobacteria bacterium]|nr:elongation factor Ts [Deltaproteobacteria bacterium]